jgi:hypothetical protein
MLEPPSKCNKNSYSKLVEKLGFDHSIDENHSRQKKEDQSKGEGHTSGG